jgi:signal transduction histidine kinase
MARCAQEPFSRLDRDLVSRAIGNLLGNALKHAPVHSTITCAVERHAGDWAILVQDQGPGIASDRQAAVFEPFARIRSSVRADGAGLGLAFVKTVASRHGGAILLNSVPGCGCAFRLVLPRAAVGQARSLQG